jgi:hypothetical protein
VRGVQPHPPEDAEEVPDEDFPPPEGAANTESWMVCFALEHFGQVIFALFFITSRSWRSPQFSQIYS